MAVEAQPDIDILHLAVRPYVLHAQLLSVRWVKRSTLLTHPGLGSGAVVACCCAGPGHVIGGLVAHVDLCALLNPFFQVSP